MNSLKTVAIIPARMAADRFPGKPLAEILGMPMIGHCYHRSKLAKNVNSVYVATCDQEIADYITQIGGRAIMTSNQHKRATTRTAEALEHLCKENQASFDIVVMVQGDEPLICPKVIDASLTPFKNHQIQIVNVMSETRSEEAVKDRNNVKVVVNRFQDALYFSREPIPSLWKQENDLPRFIQTGIIAFRPSALSKFNQMEESTLEKMESIDMNRVVEEGGKIRMIATKNETFGIDTPSELRLAERILERDPTTKEYLNF